MVGANARGDAESGDSKESQSAIPLNHPPQKSILDFFKSPNKAPPKPRDLLGYFGQSAQLSAAANLDGHVQESKVKKRKRADRVISCDSSSGDDRCHSENAEKGYKNRKTKKKKVDGKVHKKLKLKKETDTRSEVNGKDSLEDSSFVVDKNWQYPRKPDDKLQKEFDVIAEEFQLCDSEVKGRVCALEESEQIQVKVDSSENVAESEGNEVILIVESSKTEKVAGSEAVVINGMVNSEKGLMNGMYNNKPRRSEKHTERRTEGSTDLDKKPVVEWKKTMDMEKIVTPKRKGSVSERRDSSCKKKRKKMKLKKPEKPVGDSQKALNLSDICDNLADVSILSDTSQGDRSGLETQMAKDTANDNGSVSEMVEASYTEFLEGAGIEATGIREINGARVLEDGDKENLDEKRKSDKEKESYDMKKREKEERSDKENVKILSRGSSRKKELPEGKINVDKGESEMTDSKNGTVKEKEVSYMDFLNSFTTEPSKGASTDSKVNTENQQAVNKVEQKGGDVSAEEIPMPKQYPCITNFFKKVDGVDKKGNSKKFNSSKVTVKVDVHSEPSPRPSPPQGRSDTSLKQSPSSGSKLDTEIEVLGSEIITLDTPKTCLKKKFVQDSTDRDLDNVKDEKRKRGRSRKSLVDELNRVQETERKLSEAKTGLRKKEGETNEAKESDDDGLCIIDESASIQETTNKVKKDFLQSNMSEQTFNRKTSQATFSFGKSGFQMKKVTPVTRVRKSHTTQEVQAETQKTADAGSVPTKSEPGKRGRGRKKKSEQDEISIGEDGICKDSPNTPIKRSSRRSRSSTSAEVSFEKYDDNDNKKEGKLQKYDGWKEKSIAERRRLICQKYSVALLDNTGKKGSPIRIRLTRYSKSSSSQDDSFTADFQVKGNKRVKVRKTAQKLLEKAKRGKLATKRKSKDFKEEKNKDHIEEQVEESPVKSERRRSSRLSNKRQSLEEVLIVDDEDSVDSSYTPKSNRGRKPKIQRPTASAKEEKKVSQKLAPIFVKKGKKEEVNSPVKKILDPETEKRRRAFLMSDVPDELRRQATAAAMVTEADYPLFPTINHVQQMKEDSCSGKYNLWKLQNVVLNLRKDWEQDSHYHSIGWRKELVQQLCHIEDKNQSIKTFTQHGKIHGEALDLILSEIAHFCPSYPVKKMYSILREKKEDFEEDVSVSENKIVKKEAKVEQDVNKAKTRPRRSLRLRPVIEVIDVIGSPEKVCDPEESSSEKQDSVPPTFTFIEKYQPLHSSEVVGNSAVLKKLKTWLTEWKHRLDREARKARMLIMKKSKDKRPKDEDSGDWWGGDTSDFDMSSDDSDDDDDTLCNTVMLTGATGVGKTASVYALAQELGFKVFEVNASSCRNGKRILSQLQEATQSHQVSKTSVGNSAGTPVKIGKKQSQSSEPSKKLPTAFTNLFKKADTKKVLDEKFVKNEGSKGRKKRKREEEDSIDETSSKKKRKDQKKTEADKKQDTNEKVANDKDTGKSINLSSTSLILFDEVDLVFEQDKGFWAAVQSFMSTTKIPIVLTSNDNKLHTKFEGRFEHYVYKIPSMVTSTIFLQLVCLVENVRTQTQDIHNLISLYNGDIRRALHTIQLWILSGGGPSLKEVVIKNKTCPNSLLLDSVQGKQPLVEKTENSKVNMSDVKGDEDDEDFMIIKPVALRRKPLLFDEDSNSLPPQLPDCALPCDEGIVEEPTTKSNTSVSLPPVHLSVMNSALGYSTEKEEDFIRYLSQMAQGRELNWMDTAVEACIQYQILKANILYNHHLALLPLPKVNIEASVISRLSGPTQQKPKSSNPRSWCEFSINSDANAGPPGVATKRRRIRLSSDLYDSDVSDNEASSVIEKSNEETDSERNKGNNSEMTKASKYSVEEGRSLSAFFEFYDTLSLIDNIKQAEEKLDLHGGLFGREDYRGTLSVGLEDQSCKFDTVSSVEIGKALCSELELRSFCKLQRQQREVVESVDAVDEDRFGVPVTQCGIRSLRNESARCYISSKSDVKRVCDNVTSNLPLSLHCHTSAVSMDYLPFLRSMSKGEQIREAAKAKRRFHHYFDNIGLPLKTTTISGLCTSFS